MARCSDYYKSTGEVIQTLPQFMSVANITKDTEVQKDTFTIDTVTMRRGYIVFVLLSRGTVSLLKMFQ